MYQYLNNIKNDNKKVKLNFNSKYGWTNSKITKMKFKNKLFWTKKNHITIENLNIVLKLF